MSALLRPSLPILCLVSASLVNLNCAPNTIQGEEKAVLTAAPNVPPPLTRDYPTKVIVELETVEKKGRLSDGVEYEFWTFGGDVPGSFIRVREGDLVEFHLNNHPTSKMPHNIDLHAVTGPGGGAAASFTAPGTGTTFSFTALNPGLFVYHCATAPVGMHISNGMYGLILVEPKEGLPAVDREYYVMQSEFYTRGDYGDPGLQPFDMGKAIEEDADYVVFNGAVGALAGEHALAANVGETVRLFVGNGGPNLISSFHVIGEIFDNVYQEGGTLVSQHNVQTTLVPAGGAAIVEFGVDVPGNLILVDHAIFRAFNKGALGSLVVAGEENEAIYSGLQEETVYLPEGGGIQNVPLTEAPDAEIEDPMVAGARIFTSNCAACHQPDGQGLRGSFPPLAGSDYLLDDPFRAVNAVVHGLSGEIVVNGETYNGVMPAVRLSDAEVAAVVTFVLNSWGNDGPEISPMDVSKARSEH